MKNLRKRCITLIEMMIVMFLIALITGVVAYNYTGSLEKGKAFKTKIGMEKLETILSIRAAEDPRALDEMPTKWKDFVKDSSLVQNVNALVKDGWGNDYQVTVENNEIKIRSEKYDEYQKKHGEIGE